MPIPRFSFLSSYIIFVYFVLIKSRFMFQHYNSGIKTGASVEASVNEPEEKELCNT
jgi:hypothetical protein